MGQLSSTNCAQPYKLTRQIRVCAECRFDYGNGEKIPDPAYDICAAHEETHHITTRQNSTFSTNTLVHYHTNPNCIWMKASFRPESLQIPEDL